MTISDELKIKELEAQVAELKSKVTLEEVLKFRLIETCIACSMQYQTTCQYTESNVCARKRIINMIWTGNPEALALFQKIRGVGE